MDKETVQSILGSLPTKTPSQGVSTLLVAALDPKLAGKFTLKSSELYEERVGLTKCRSLRRISR
jgi:hypothetical protein